MTGCRTSPPLMHSLLVESHPYCRIHPDLLKCIYFPARPDAARRDDRERGRAAEAAKPLQVRSAHGSLAVYVGAQKCGAKWFELRHHVFGPKPQPAPPTVSHDVAVPRVERDHDMVRLNFL